MALLVRSRSLADAFGVAVGIAGAAVVTAFTTVPSPGVACDAAPLPTDSAAVADAPRVPLPADAALARIPPPTSGD